MTRQLGLVAGWSRNEAWLGGRVFAESLVIRKHVLGGSRERKYTHAAANCQDALPTFSVQSGMTGLVAVLGAGRAVDRLHSLLIAVNLTTTHQKVHTSISVWAQQFAPTLILVVSACSVTTRFRRLASLVLSRNDILAKTSIFPDHSESR